MEENEHYRLLVQRYQNNRLSEEELEVFFHLLGAGKLDRPLLTAMNEAGSIGMADSAVEILAEETAAISVSDPALRSLPSSIPVRHRLPLPKRIAVAAVFLLVFGGGVLIWKGMHRTQTYEKTATIVPKAILPGSNKAILTLSNGSVIALDSAANGLLTKQGNSNVLKQRGGQLAYQHIGSLPATTVYNTVTTPRGGEYQVLLPDGTKVWLNASSSLRFPTAFNGRDRSVMVTGEAYFQVAKDPVRPFMVSAASGLRVEVLGTDFNIMAYNDESEIKTTLIRGAVKVIRGAVSELLHPGDQARVLSSVVSIPATTGEPSIRLIHNTDTSAAIAWTTGFFQFEDLEIRSIMRQIGRWYDVGIVYDPAVTNLPVRHFGGRISRHLNLTDVLQILEANKIHFRVEASTICVLP